MNAIPTRLRTALLAGLAALPLAGCFPIESAFNRSTHVAYQMNPQAGADDSTIQHLKASGPGSTATLGFLEFDDQGEPWRLPEAREGWTHGSRTQLPAVIAEIDRLSRQGPVKTVVFIHGWNHGAKPGDSNLEDFKRSLMEIAAVSNSPVFGVYVGWRGKVAPVSVYLDVGSREATAARVGGPSLLASLRAVSEATHRNRQSSVTAIGHSFGAKILTQVTCNQLASQIGSRIGGETRELAPLADTVILANTAENGALPLQLMNLMRDHRLSYESTNGAQRDLPLVVSICSVEDRATKKLLPIWNNFARIGMGFPHKGGATSSRVQDHALFNSMGFYGPLQSHRIYLDGKPAENVKTKWKSYVNGSWNAILKENVRLGARWPASNGSALDLALSASGDPAGFNTYTVNRLSADDFQRYSDGAQPNDTPFWFIQVPGFVSGGHNDLWNPNFTGLVAALESMRSPTTTAKRQGKLAPGPKPLLEVTPLR